MRRDFIADGTLAEDFPLPYLTLDELRDSLELTPDFRAWTKLFIGARDGDR